MKKEKVYIPLHPEVDKIISYQGGFPLGHMFEIFGPDGEGKTTLALLLAASAQRMGLKVGWVDIEFGFNADHARFFGVEMPEDYKQDSDKWHYVAPTTGEEAMDTVLKMCQDGYGLVIADSVGGLVPAAMLEDNSKQFGQVASLLAKTLPAIRMAAHYGNTAVVLINQIRAKIVKFSPQGPTTESFGGYTLKHTVDARFEIRKVAWIKYSTNTIGFKLRIRAPKKNRFAPAARDGYLDVICDHEAPSLDDINKRRKVKVEAIGFKDKEEE